MNRNAYKILHRVGGKSLLIFLYGLGLSINSLQAQDNVYVSPGTGVGFFQDTVVIYGKFTVDGGSVFFKPGANVFFFGDTMKVIPGSTITGEGKFIFKGPRLLPTMASFAQYLDGGGVQLASAVIANPLDVKLFGNATGVLDTLRFASGNLILNNNNFTVGSGNPGVIDGYTENNFVVTNGPLNATTGFLIRDNVGSSTEVFPIGQFGYYEPASISNTGTSDLIRMRIAHGVNEFVTSGSQQNDRSTQMTWFVEEGTPGGSNATINLQHNRFHEGVHFGNYHDYQFISRYVGFNPNTEGDTISYTNWDNFGKASTSGGTTPGFLTTGAPIANAVVTTRTGLTYFGPLAKTVWNDPWMVIPLPIEFLDIHADWKTENIAKIGWTVGDDAEANYYQLERVLPGESKFSAIAKIQARGINSPLNYSYEDVITDVRGAILYKVVAYNINGSKTESKAVSLSKRAGSAGVVMAPNPSAKYVEIRTFGDIVEQENLKVEIFTNAGALILTNNDPNGQMVHINTEFWSEGVYMVRITYGAQTQTQKLVVNHLQ